MITGERQSSAFSVGSFPTVESFVGSIADSIEFSLYAKLNIDVQSEHSYQHHLLNTLPKAQQPAALLRYQQTEDFYKALRACTRTI